MTKKKHDGLSTEEISTYEHSLKEYLKDVNNEAEITRLKEEIESIRAEIYNLKMLAAKGK